MEDKNKWSNMTDEKMDEYQKECERIGKLPIEERHKEENKLLDMGAPMNFSLRYLDEVVIIGFVTQAIIKMGIKNETTVFTLKQCLKLLLSIEEKKVIKIYNDLFKTGLFIRYTEDTPDGKVTGYRFKWTCTDEITTESFL